LALNKRESILVVIFSVKIKQLLSCCTHIVSNPVVRGLGQSRGQE